MCEAFCDSISTSLSTKLDALSNLPTQTNNLGYEKRICKLEFKNAQLESKISKLEISIQQLLKPNFRSDESLSAQNVSHAILRASSQNTLNKYITLAQPELGGKTAPKPPVAGKAIHPNNMRPNNNLDTRSNPQQSRLDRYNKRPIIIGTSTNDNAFTASERRQWLYIGRCNPNTTEVQISDYIKNHLCIPDVQCILLDKNDDVSSFKVGVKESLLRGLLDPNLWPAGTAVKQFLPRRNRL